MQTTSKIALYSLAAWLSFATPTLAVNLVANGGFETGDFTSWTTEGTISNLFFVSDFTPHSGTYSVLFADIDTDSTQIYQSVTTTSGQQYTLDFWVYNLGVGENGLKVSWEGNLVLDSTPLEVPLEQWSLFSLPLSATNDGSELRFEGFDNPLGYYIDDISLTPVPEPSRFLLAAMGLVFLAIRRQRSIG